MKELITAEPIAVILLMLAVFALGFAYISRTQYPQLIDRMARAFDSKYMPQTQSEKWLYEKGFVRLNNRENTYALPLGAYKTGLDYEVFYVVVHQSFTDETHQNAVFTIAFDNSRGVNRIICDGLDLSEAQADEIEAQVKDGIYSLFCQYVGRDYEEVK